MLKTLGFLGFSLLQNLVLTNKPFLQCCWVIYSFFLLLFFFIFGILVIGQGSLGLESSGKEPSPKHWRCLKLHQSCTEHQGSLWARTQPPLTLFDRIRPFASWQSSDVMGKMQSGILYRLSNGSFVCSKGKFAFTWLQSLKVVTLRV